MTEYLYEHGLTKLAFVGSIHFSSSIMDRYCGFSKAVLEHRDVTPAEWILEDRDERGQIEIHLPEQMPEAFVCNCDLTAGLLMLELEKRGISVPEDVSVIGFDDVEYAKMCYPGLTTMRQNIMEKGRQAARLMIEAVQDHSLPREERIIPMELIERGTVKRVDGNQAYAQRPVSAF